MVRAGPTKRSGREGARRTSAPSSVRPDRVAELREIPLDKIQLPRQPVRRFLGDVANLAASMQEYGLQQPISVRAEGEQYILTSGLRRLTAARMLGWTSIAAFVRSVSADDAYVIDLVENLQREDLSPEEEADALGELVRTRRWTLDQVAEAVKRSPGYVSKRVRLFEDPDLRDAVLQRGLAVSTAELLLGVAAKQRSALIERAIAEQWDQMRVRDELQSAQAPVAALKQPRKLTSTPQRDQVPGAAGARPGSRPPGFTRKIREFYRTILTIRSEDLTPADRSAMRTLFKALVMLARAQTAPTAPVFPPLPEQRGGGRTRTQPPALNKPRNR
jgi:ParB family transcriptional regulator, chromosome partitioning protein